MESDAGYGSDSGASEYWRDCGGQRKSIFYVNPAYSDILNVAPGKIIGRYMNQIEKDAALLEVLETQKPKRRENS